MKPTTLPWFKFFVTDFWTDEKVKMMSDAEVGQYIKLLSHQWVEGSVPRDSGAVEMLLKCTPSQLLLSCFEVTKDEERMINKRLERERRNAATSKDNRSKSGKLGAMKKWQRDGDTNGKGMAIPMAKGWPAHADLRSQRSEETKTNVQGDLGLVTFDLEEIYRIYPRHAGKKKGLEVLKRKIKTQEQYDLIRKAAETYAESQRGVAERYILIFSSWVNAERWLDNIAVADEGPSLVERILAEQAKKEELRREQLEILGKR